MSKLDLVSRVPAQYEKQTFADIIRAICGQVNPLSEGKLAGRYQAQSSVPSGSVAAAVSDIVWDSNATVRGSVVSGIAADYVRLGWVVNVPGNPGTYQELRIPTGTGAGVTGPFTGTSTNDNAGAGQIGEYTISQSTVGAATSFANATPANAVSIALTAGDWDVTGVLDYKLTGASTTDFKSGISSTSATFGAQDTFLNLPLILTLLSDTVGHGLPVTRFSLAGTTTVYLVGQVAFSAGSASGYGTLRARRIR